MNTPSTIRDQLAQAARGRDRATRLANLLAVVGLVLLALLGVAVVDYGFILPAKVRWVGVAAMALLLLAGMIRWMWLRGRPTSLKQSALDVESAQPRSGCEVSTAAEYATGERKISQEYEQELVTALEQRAAVTVAQTSLPYGRRVVWPGLVLLGVLMALGTFLVTVPAAGTALKRTAAPWTQAAFARVEVTPGAVEIPVGRPLEITGRFSGRQPERAELQILEPGQTDWKIWPLVASTNGDFQHTLPAVQSSFAYRVIGLDAVSDEFAVTSFIPPEVKELRVRLEPPTYTGLKPQEQASGDVTSVRGTRATFHLIPTVPLTRAQLRFTNGMVLDLQPGPNEQWSAPLPVSQDNEYRFELTDAKGRRGGDELAHHIIAVPDTPPQVDFTTPGQDIRAAATNRLALKLTARDDFGVTEVKIVYHRLGAPEREFVVERVVKQDQEYQADAELDLTELKLKEFELVAYHAEARDNNTLDGPGIGRSPTYFVEITDLEAGQCLSQSQGQKVNLLVIQKQIIADTAALTAQPSADQFKELAVRQKDAIEFGRMYQQALSQTGAPLAVQGMMNSAVTAMEKAESALEAQKQGAALPPEESALASLYQVVRLMPQLVNLPTTPPPVAQEKSPTPPAVKVVLEAIKKQKKEPPNRQEMARLLEQIQQLGRKQTGLNAACQNPGSNPGSANNPAQGSGKPGDGKPGDGKPESESKTPENKASENKELAKLAPQQEQLSKEARELAERIARLAGKGSRAGQGAGQRMNAAAGKMTQAAQAMRSGQGETAGTAGDESSASVSAAAALLEILLSGQPELSDVAAEDAPKQYEAAIADYFKRLSHAE